MDDPTPSILYKYYPPVKDRHQAIFTRHELYFPSPLEFNDPFDCTVPPSWEGTNEEFVAFFTRVLVNQGHLDPAAAHKRALTFVAGGHHRVMPEMEQTGYREQLDRLAHMGVFCLAENRASLLMWSHYSRSHKGFCLGFKSGDDAPFFGRAQMIHYAEDLPVARFAADTEEEVVRKMLLTKGRDWEYEREWRIIEFDGVPGPVRYPAEFLIEVVLGLEMDDDDKTVLRAFARDGHCRARFLQARREKGKFALTFDEVDGP